MPYVVEDPLTHSPLTLGATFYSGSGVGRHKVRDSRTWVVFTIYKKIRTSRYVVSARVPKIAPMKPFWHTKQHSTNGKSIEGGRAIKRRSSPTTPTTLAASDADCGFLSQYYFLNTSFSPAPWV